MSDEDLEDWILDTISEGGYSFSELADYFNNHSIRSKKLSKGLNNLFIKNLVKITITTNVKQTEFEVSIDRLIELIEQKILVLRITYL